jgi:hypothetical protein
MEIAERFVPAKSNAWAGLVAILFFSWLGQAAAGNPQRKRRSAK